MKPPIVASPPTVARAALRRLYRADEAQCVQALLDEYRPSTMARQSIASIARALVSAVRAKRVQASGVDALMHEFSLSSQEGVALMCLAEALLRIPDADTADALIRDKIAAGDWQDHLGNSPSLFVNAAAWGLLITGRLVASHSEAGLLAALRRLVAKGGEPLIRAGVDAAMRMLGNQFVTGRTIEEALQRSREMTARGYCYSYDMLGEAALTEADAERYFRAYADAIDAIGADSAGRGIYDGPGISVKLSALHPRYQRSQRDRVLRELLPRLRALALAARNVGIGINIDAEEADRLELSLDLLEALALDPELRAFDGIGFVVQAYGKRAPAIIDWLAELAKRRDTRIMVRLVKGAYWDSEIKRAQVDGAADFPVFTRKPHTDLSFLVCAQRLLKMSNWLYPQLATHNAHTVASIATMAQRLGVTDFEFQCLHGMGEALYDEVIGADQLQRGQALRCRIYAPVGSHETLLAYLVRRLLENGANSSFVNRIVDPAVPMELLIADPTDFARAHHGAPHPAIRAPAELFVDANRSGRRNSNGFDLTDETTLQTWQQAFDTLRDRQWQAEPLLANSPRPAARMPAQAIINPARHDDQVGWCDNASAEHVELAFSAAAAALSDAPNGQARWHAHTADQRAAILERAADLFETDRFEFFALVIREAGRTLADAVTEVREAVDFLRYYAAQARAGAPAAPLGVVACISPWNFPLAIFTGQIAAALAAGNHVIAKPAEQTPLIAACAVRLMHQAGVPAAALQYIPGDGTVGARLTGDPRCDAVIFTGSTEVARLIERSQAKLDVDSVGANSPRAQAGVARRLIAETGGQNALIVDSSALPEQVVNDALASAFNSAGQRCSALRLLCVQHEIADRVLPMLRDALDELQVGDPAWLATDVGPVIDRPAADDIERHISAMIGRGHRVDRLRLPVEAARGSFVAPAIIEISAIGELTHEVFGPVLHVLRYRRDQLDALIDAINATGYGLTFGVHSRIDETIDRLIERIQAGNVYVNRNIIGAVVGVQPFGGVGLSGTGPKAGGPNYVPRLTLPDTGAARPATPAGEIELTGPTGERNTLRWRPRGTVLLSCTDHRAVMRADALARSTGNRATTDRRRSRVDAVITEDWAQARRLREQLAAADGPIIPVIALSDPHATERLMLEQTVTVNTAAAGGNASLMTLAE